MTSNQIKNYYTSTRLKDDQLPPKLLDYSYIRAVRRPKKSHEYVVLHFELNLKTYNQIDFWLTSICTSDLNVTYSL